MAEDGEYNINELMKLDYENCDKLRFGFRDIVHKYALMYVVLIGAYLAYGKYVLNPEPDTAIQENLRFLVIVGVGFGIGLSVAIYMGFRVYCRNRLLSVYAVRSQQVIRAKVCKDYLQKESALLTGLKVVRRSERSGREYLFIPHSVSRGEYEAVVFMCIATTVPISLSLPYYSKFFSLFGDPYISSFSFSTYLLAVGVFFWWLAHTLENTIGHLSEANAISDHNRAPIFPKTWGDEKRDRSRRFVRKEPQGIFLFGYGLLLFLPLCIIIILNESQDLDDIWNISTRLSLVVSLLGLPLLLGSYICEFGRRLFFAVGSSLFCFGVLSSLTNFFTLPMHGIGAPLLIEGLIVFCKDTASVLFLIDGLGEYSSALIAINILLKSIAFYYLGRIILFAIVKRHRFRRNHIVLETQALFAASKEHGIYDSMGKRLESEHYKNYIRDHFAYYVYKHNCYGYKGVFKLEDCKNPGDLYKKMMNADKALRENGNAGQAYIKGHAKLVCLVPKYRKMLLNCWNMQFMAEDWEKHCNYEEQ